MNLLGLDTSSDTFILGLEVAGELLDGSAAVGRERSRRILPAVEALLSAAGLARHRSALEGSGFAAAFHYSPRRGGVQRSKGAARRCDGGGATPAR